jgi:hypothetical protein
MTDDTQFARTPRSRVLKAAKKELAAFERRTRVPQKRAASTSGGVAVACNQALTSFENGNESIEGAAGRSVV